MKIYFGIINYRKIKRFIGVSWGDLFGLLLLLAAFAVVGTMEYGSLIK